MQIFVSPISNRNLCIHSFETLQLVHGRHSVFNRWPLFAHSSTSDGAVASSFSAQKSGMTVDGLSSSFSSQKSGMEKSGMAVDASSFLPAFPAGLVARPLAALDSSAPLLSSSSTQVM
jgi:hypothetical protein